MQQTLMLSDYRYKYYTPHKSSKKVASNIISIRNIDMFANTALTP